MSQTSKKHKASASTAASRKVAKQANGTSAADSKSVGDYTWKDVHTDLENGKAIGVYGGCNSVYFGLSELRSNVNMEDFHTKRSKDEFYLPQLDEYLKNPNTQRRWGDLVTIDPMGMYAKRPTMSATTAHMNVPELGDVKPDGKIVNADGSVNVIKVAVDYVWNLPAFSKRLGFAEKDVREKLFKYTQIPQLKDTSLRAFLPPTGGCTVYIIGDPRKLSDTTTEVAIRVHDSCCGSDVFGTDICTCRPYLMFALKSCVECAKRGGVGIVVYFQKEGRSLGEVTKFRVYNARKAQPGGDRPEKYFYQTESIAGIRDARFQEMMPDILLWLGITRIDWLLSMSSEKYDAITSLGIEVMQRVALPDQFVPAHAGVEINAKISAGYHTNTIDSEEVIGNLRSLSSIRQRCGQIYELAEQKGTKHFSLHLEKLPACVDLVVKTIKQNYPQLKIPYHARWRHFNQSDVDKMVQQWPVNDVENARRLLDLCTVSVLLDAGAGTDWKYVDEKGNTHSRSEGLAIASFDMFKSGIFSSDIAQPHRVNSHGLKALNFHAFSRGFQVSNTNPMVGVKGRFNLMKRLGKALDNAPEFFGKELRRPGNIVDYVLRFADKDKKVSIKVLWRAIIEGLESIWPNNLSGIRRGDIWVYNPLKKVGDIGSDMVPFHKLSQWLAYSMLEPIEALGVKFTDMHLLTGLAEYRNGGLMVDTGVLVLRNKEHEKIFFDVGSELVVEWRALTVILLDKIADEVRKALGKTPEEMPLAMVLEGGTWCAGRVIAKQLRPGGPPPINIRSDGSVF